MTIELRDQYGEFLISADEGVELGSLIARALNSGVDVELNCVGVSTILASFLNPAIGSLYEQFSQDELERRVRVAGASDVQLESFARVREHARLYYDDPAYRAAHDVMAADIAVR